MIQKQINLNKNQLNSLYYKDDKNNKFGKSNY